MLARHTCNICGFLSLEIRNTRIHVSKSQMCSRKGASVVSSDIVLSNSDRRTGGREIISGSNSAAPDADEVPDTEAAPNNNGNSDATGSILIQGPSRHGVGIPRCIIRRTLHPLQLKRPPRWAKAVAEVGLNLIFWVLFSSFHSFQCYKKFDCVFVPCSSKILSSAVSKRPSSTQPEAKGGQQGGAKPGKQYSANLEMYSN